MSSFLGVKDRPNLTGSDIKAAYEAQNDTNGFTNSEKQKLGRIAVSSIAEMAALDDLTDGDACVVLPSGETFKYHAASVLIADETLIVTATGMGAGRLISERKYFGDVPTLLDDPRGYETHAENDYIAGPEFNYKVLAPGAIGRNVITNAGGAKLAAPLTMTGVPITAFKASTPKELVLAVSNAAQQYANADNSNGAGQQEQVNILLEPGQTYDFGGETLGWDSILRDVNIGCMGGSAAIVGTGIGLDLERIRNMRFFNLNFKGFTTATRWKTDNVDTNLIRYDYCDFNSCDLGIDTRSYAESRSTLLEMRHIQTGSTKRLFQSYCDMTTLLDFHARGFDTDGPFAFADSQLIVERGVVTPYTTGFTDNACLFEISNEASNAENGSFTPRSASISNVRGGPENGGLAMVNSRLNHNPAGGTRTTMSYISLTDVYVGVTDTARTRAIVQLKDNAAGTETLTPNVINIRGGSINCPDGAVATESALPISAAVGVVTINIDDGAQARWGSETVDPSTPIIQENLEKYMSHWRIEDKTIAVSGSTVSVGSRKVVRLSAAAAIDVTDLLDALNGHRVSVIFSDGNITLKDIGSGGRFRTKGGADIIGAQNNAYSFIYDRATLSWIEV